VAEIRMNHPPRARQAGDHFEPCNLNPVKLGGQERWYQPISRVGSSSDAASWYSEPARSSNPKRGSEGSGRRKRRDSIARGASAAAHFRQSRVVVLGSPPMTAGWQRTQKLCHLVGPRLGTGAIFQVSQGEGHPAPGKVDVGHHSVMLSDAARSRRSSP
jgi:hypothetical protein